jgi:hypothetical protein
VIILSKILPFFLMPLGVTTALVLAGIVFRRRLLCLVGILVLWVAAMPVTSDPFIRMIVGHAVRMAAEDMPGADAIVVLSGGRGAGCGVGDDIQYRGFVWSSAAFDGGDCRGHRGGVCAGCAAASGDLWGKTGGLSGGLTLVSDCFYR